VNPTAGGGRCRQQWPQILARLLDVTPRLSVRWTTGPGAATTLTRTALADGFDRIVAVGGDGTVHEVVNGFFRGTTPLAPHAVLAHVPVGTGSDFGRALGVGTGCAAVNRLAASGPRRIDLLRATVTTDAGRCTRYVANIASFGLGGVVVRAVRRLRSRTLVSGRLAYLGGILYSLCVHTPPVVTLSVDGTSLGRCRIHNGAVANGHTFGGGLRIAPDARLDDGRLHLVVLHALSIGRLVRHAPRFYRGTHTTLDGVTALAGRRVRAESATSVPVLVDLDGEPVGRLPATFEIVPNAIRVQA
jgi:YegS/Rv2252/BmrU family lipid kinase